MFLQQLFATLIVVGGMFSCVLAVIMVTVGCMDQKKPPKKETPKNAGSNTGSDGKASMRRQRSKSEIDAKKLRQMAKQQQHNSEEEDTTFENEGKKGAPPKIAAKNLRKAPGTTPAKTETKDETKPNKQSASTARERKSTKSPKTATAVTTLHKTSPKQKHVKTPKHLTMTDRTKTGTISEYDSESESTVDVTKKPNVCATQPSKVNASVAPHTNTTTAWETTKIDKGELVLTKSQESSGVASAYV